MAVTLVLAAGATAVLISARDLTETESAEPNLLAAFRARPTVTAPPRPSLPPLPTSVAPSSAARPLLPGQPRRLTDGGCCAGAWWSDDSWQVRFVDKPEDALTAGIYGAPVWPPESAVALLSSEVLESALANPLVVRPGRGYAMIEDTASGDKWPLPTDGKPLRISPDGARAVWWDAPRERYVHDTLVRIYGSDIYGFDDRELGALYGAEVIGFLRDSRFALVAGRPARQDATRLLASLDLEEGSMKELDSGAWLGEVLLAPEGGWAAYLISLDREQPEENGVWVVPTSGGEPWRQDWVGSYRWRDAHRLLYIPMELEGRTNTLWQLDVETRETAPLLGQDVPYFRVANNDWSVSPDGESIVFRSELDRNLWVIDLSD